MTVAPIGNRWLTVPVALFIASRAAIFVVGGYTLHIDKHTYYSQAPVASNVLVQAMTRFDGGWFIRIANEGYAERVNANFFPLFPLVGRYVSRATGISVPAALVICANVIGLAALIVVYRLFLEIEGQAGAAAAIGLLVAWPFSFFQAAAYPESLMMLSTASAAYFARRRFYVAGGVALGIGVLARHLTCLGCLLLITPLIRARGPEPRGLLLRGLIGIGAAFAIGSIYPAYLWAHFGDWLVWARVRDQWGTSSRWGLYDFLTDASVRRPEIVLYVILSIVPGVGALLMLARARWRDLAPFAAGLMILLWGMGLAGLGRYCGSCWPAFLPIGAILARRPSILIAMIVFFCILQGMTLYLFVHLYPIM